MAAIFTLCCTFLLVLLLVFLNITGSAFNLLVLVVQLIPLGLTLPGQLKRTARAYQWLCFVVLFFLVQGILLAFTPGMRTAGIVETAVCLSLFFSAIIFIRASHKTGQPMPTATENASYVQQHTR